MALRVAGVAFGMAAFTGTHLLLSHPPVRQDLIAKLGDQKFKGLYSMIALGTLVPTAFFYARFGRGVGPRLYNTTSLIQRLGGFGFKALGAITFSQAVTQPNPIVINANREPGAKITEKDVEAKGIYRISRHATFMSFALLGIGNVLTRGHLSDIIFWGTFPIYWVVGSTMQDERLKLTYPASYFENTSLLPFHAVIKGKQSLKEALAEMSPKSAIIALLAPVFFL
ncbi:hypothetical protein HK105_204675 [Polyrhizophydium stewartii]|uniref:NnrU domain-containing protein n=1 Tax=Polyrhizophydium stewartii TaxID=2732419 RepID=A0ABR4N891_9FUNG